MGKRLLNRLQPVFLILAILFIGWLLHSQWDDLRRHHWQLNYGWLAASAGFLLAAWAVEIAIWRHLLVLIGGRLAYWPAVRIWFISAIARYIPGNVWQPLSMTLLCQRRGIAPEATLTSIALYQVIILLAVAPIAALYFVVTGNWGLLTSQLHAFTPWLVVLGLLPLVVFVVWPSWLIEGVNWALRKINRPTLQTGLSRSELLRVLLAATVDWLLWGAAFAALAFALDNYSPAQMAQLAPDLVAVYSVAYAIGFLSFITPSGLGVREGAFYLLLAPLMGGGVVTVLALAMRLWTTLGELIAAGISVVFQARDPASARHSAHAGDGAEDPVIRAAVAAPERLT